jgi:hypothetical protein
VKTRSLLSALTCVAAPLAAQASRPSVARVSWLQGCWVGGVGLRAVEEQWSAPRGRAMMGMGRTFRGDSLVEYELVVVRERDSSLIYVAHPSGQPSATFTVSQLTDSSVVFENAAHDFPQRVGYRRVGSDSLVAHIEGTLRGLSRRIEFPYSRARCAGS